MKYIVMIVLVSLITGCTVKLCNCNENEVVNKSKNADANSTLIDISLTPRN